MTNYLLCCDWGTSSLRLQLLNFSNYQTIGEVHSPEGIAVTFDAWHRTGEPNGVAKDYFFRRQLKQQIDRLADNLSISLANVPVSISGMASSSIGMAEIPYATLPFAVDGSQSRIQHSHALPDFPHEIMLISGVSSRQDVMRGEETQLIGLIALLNQAGDSPKEAIFILPGTHSKHLCVQAGRLTSFTTYMTGELFDLMTRHSVLTDSINLSGLTELSDRNRQAFRLGVRQAMASSLLNSLFTVRTNQLFGKFDKTENAFYLSGLVIGSELVPLLTKRRPLVLSSGRSLAAFYELAIDELNLSARTTTIAPELADRAASVGQAILYQNQVINQTVK